MLLNMKIVDNLTHGIAFSLTCALRCNEFILVSSFRCCTKGVKLPMFETGDTGDARSQNVCVTNC